MSRRVFGPYIALFVQESRGTIEGSAKIVGIVSAFTAVMSALSGIIIGRLGRRYNKLNIIKIAFTIGIFITITIILSKGMWMFVIFYGFMMLAIGGVEAIMLSLASQHINQDERGAMFGFISMQNAFAWVIATLIGSYISIEFSIRSIIFVIPVFLIIALVLRRMYAVKYYGKDNI